MTVEAANYIGELNPTYPADGDFRYEGDDHLRLVKFAAVNSFPNVKGAVTKTHGQLNATPHDRTGVISLLGHEITRQGGNNPVWLTWGNNKINIGINDGAAHIPMGPLVLLSEFSGGNASLGQTGFQRFPSGLLIQWGYTTMTSLIAVGQTAGHTFSFPRAFIGSGVIVASSCSEGLGSNGLEGEEHNIAAGFLNLSQGRITISRTSGANTGGETLGVFWMATGVG